MHASLEVNRAEFKASRAVKDPFGMMELLIDQFIDSKDSSCPANPLNRKANQKARYMTPLETLNLYKEILKEDDMPLRFDLFSLRQRCLKPLRRVQNNCVELSPLNYPPETGSGDKNILRCMIRMLEGVVKWQPIRFEEACALISETIANERNVGYLAAQARMGIVKGTVVDPKDDPEDFEDPDEALILPEFRKSIKEASSEELVRLRSRKEDVGDFLARESFAYLENPL